MAIQQAHQKILEMLEEESEPIQGLNLPMRITFLTRQPIGMAKEAVTLFTYFDIEDFGPTRKSLVASMD